MASNEMCEDKKSWNKLAMVCEPGPRSAWPSERYELDIGVSSVIDAVVRAIKCNVIAKSFLFKTHQLSRKFKKMAETMSVVRAVVGPTRKLTDNNLKIIILDIPKIMRAFIILLLFKWELNGWIARMARMAMLWAGWKWPDEMCVQYRSRDQFRFRMGWRSWLGIASDFKYFNRHSDGDQKSL